jgi:hypothetical protein
MGHTFGLHIDEESGSRSLARWLAGFSKLSRDNIRLLGYLDAAADINVCEGVQ